MKLPSTRARFSALLLAGVLAGVSAAPSVEAQPKPAAAAKKPDKKTTAAARKAYGEGDTAFKAGDFAAAEAGFKKANELIPSPHAQYWIAMSIDKQGRPVDAIAALEAFLGSPDKDKAGAEKVAEAQKRLDELTSGTVKLTLSPAGATITVDGKAEMGQSPFELKLKPGAHTIIVSAPGHESHTMDIEVAASSTTEKSVELVAIKEDPVAVVAPPPPAPEPEPEPPPVEKKPRSKVPGWITIGVAGAGAIVGTVFGIQALGAKGDFDDDPTTNRADDVERNALIADMAFGVAITLGITGVVLLTTDGSDSGDEAKLRKRPKRVAKKKKTKKSRRLVVAPFASRKGGGAAAQFSF